MAVPPQITKTAQKRANKQIDLFVWGAERPNNLSKLEKAIWENISICENYFQKIEYGFSFRPFYYKKSIFETRNGYGKKIPFKSDLKLLLEGNKASFIGRKLILCNDGGA